MVFNLGVVPAKATEISYNGSRIEHSVVSWMPAGTFAMTTFIRIWMWQLSIASSNSMLKDMNNAYIGISMKRLYSSCKMMAWSEYYNEQNRV
jgi:hypothetical protein